MTATSSFTADASGRTVSRPGPDGVTQSLSWDETGELVAVTARDFEVARMVYDATGARVVRRNGLARAAHKAGSPAGD